MRGVWKGRCEGGEIRAEREGPNGSRQAEVLVSRVFTSAAARGRGRGRG